MSKKKKHNHVPVPHAFGPAYGQWLNFLESYEDYANGRINKRKIIAPTYPEGLDFEAKMSEDYLNPLSSQYDKRLSETYGGLFGVWATLAASMRNAFKFKIDNAQFKLWSEENKNNNVVTYLPFENVYLQYDWGTHSELLLCERRTLDEDYPELGLVVGDTFISVTPSLYTQKNSVDKATRHLFFQGVNTMPLELHFQEGFEWSGHSEHSVESNKCWWEAPYDSICPPMIEAAPKGINIEQWEKRKYTKQYIHCLLALLAMLGHSDVKQQTYGTVKAGNVIRRKPQHKKRHPMYEYRVLEIDVGNTLPSVNVQVPKECPKKRLHAVRGFVRTYKKPLKSGPNKGKTQVLVRDHWRGDKELGVVRKDYTFINSAEGVGDE